MYGIRETLLTLSAVVGDAARALSRPRTPTRQPVRRGSRRICGYGTACVSVADGMPAMEGSPSEPAARAGLGSLEARFANVMLGPQRAAGGIARVTASTCPIGAGRLAQRNRHVRPSTHAMSDGARRLFVEGRGTAVVDEASGAGSTPPRDVWMRAREAAAASRPLQGGGAHG